MEYRGFTPDEIKKDMRKNTVFIILVTIPLLLGLFLLVGGVKEIVSIRVDDASMVSYQSMSGGQVYYFDEMVLVDAYASYGNSATGYVEKSYYIVSFTDADGNRVYTTLQTENVSAFDEKCKAYIEDENLDIGDVILSGCFHGYRNGAMVQSYFEDAYQVFKAERPGQMLDWTFYYDDAETIEAYRSKKNNRSICYVRHGCHICCSQCNRHLASASKEEGIESVSGGIQRCCVRAVRRKYGLFSQD